MTMSTSHKDDSETKVTFINSDNSSHSNQDANASSSSSSPSSPSPINSIASSPVMDNHSSCTCSSSSSTSQTPCGICSSLTSTTKRSKVLRFSPYNRLNDRKKTDNTTNTNTNTNTITLIKEEKKEVVSPSTSTLNKNTNINTSCNCCEKETEDEASSHDELSKRTSSTKSISSTNCPENEKNIEKEKSKKVTCLVVEDNDVNQKIIKGFLDRLGFESDYAVNGLEAVQIAEVKKYDVILMDIMMPVMDGIESTKIIRQTELNKQSLIIAVTAMGQSEQYFKSKGMDDFLAKPFTREKLYSILNRYNIATK